MGAAAAIAGVYGILSELTKDENENRTILDIHMAKQRIVFFLDFLGLKWNMTQGIT